MLDLYVKLKNSGKPVMLWLVFQYALFYSKLHVILMMY
ncbi:hypothetical protein ISS312_00115 [Alteromonas mediterranea]|nr:hypothetical protein ISS312_00115 [Alteromonas mediterranea]